MLPTPRCTIAEPSLSPGQRPEPVRRCPERDETADDDLPVPLRRGTTISAEHARVDAAVGDLVAPASIEVDQRIDEHALRELISLGLEAMHQSPVVPDSTVIVGERR